MEHLSIAEVIKRTGIPDKTLRRYLRTHEAYLPVERRARGIGVRSDALPTIHYIRDLYQKGRSAKEVEAALGNRNTICDPFEDPSILESLGNAQDKKVEKGSRLSSEERLKRTQEIAKLGSWEFHRETNEIEWSKETYMIFGRESQSFQPTYEALLEAIHPDDQEMLYQAHRDSLHSSEGYTVEYRIMKGDTKELRYVREKGVHERDSKGRVISSLGVVYDITQEKRTQQLLQAQVNLVRLVDHTLKDVLQKMIDEVCEITGSPIGFCHFLDSDQKTLTLTAWSTQTLMNFCKVEGEGMHYSLDKAGIWADCARYGKPIIHNDYASLADRKGMPKGHALITRELLVPVIRYGRVVAVLGVGNKDKDYSKEDQEAVVRFVDVAWGVAERKQIEENLRRSERTYREIFDGVNDALFIHDIHTGDILDANVSMFELFGYQREDLPSLSVECLSDKREPYSMDYARNLIQRAAEGETMVFEWLNKKKNGDLFYSENILKHVMIAGQERIMAIVRDITDRKQAEAELQKLAKLLAFRNKELEQIIYVASHDLRSPLVNVDGFSRELEYSLQDLGHLFHKEDHSCTELLRTLRREFPDMELCIKRIRASAHQMHILIKGLLTLSRSGQTTLRIRPIDMNALIKQVFSSFAFRIKEAGMEFTVEDLPGCLGDSLQLTQVFSNLLDNAIKYRSKDKKGMVRIQGCMEGGCSVYRVEDNGIGMEEDHQRKIFELFHRLHPNDSEGDGLGLAIVSQVLHRLDGEISVESKVGVGSVFVVRLPSA